MVFTLQEKVFIVVSYSRYQSYETAREGRETPQISQASDIST